MKISQKIANFIETQIREGILLPGDTIQEVKLMETFDVSRTPVREALLQLKIQGLITNLPRDGMAVAKMDVQQLLAMWELLAELESLCARYACERMSAEEIAQLEQLHKEASLLVNQEDEVGWQQANMKFHEILYHGSRNTYLRQQILLMRTRTGAYRRHAFGAVGRVHASHAQHELVVQAILAGNCQDVAQLMFNHMSPGHGTKGVTEMIVNMPKAILG